MRSRSWSRTTNRRGHTIVEVSIASLVLLLVLGSVLGVLDTAARLEQGILLQRGTDEQASRSMNHLIQDIREAKRVDVIRPWHLRIYYPVVRSDGHYDRYVTDEEHFVQYAQTDSRGQPDANGTYLWRSTDQLVGASIARDVKYLRVNQQGRNALRISLRLQKTGRGRGGDTQLNERVLYLRNY